MTGLVSNHPECDKMLAVHEDSQKLGEFLEWLSTVGLRLAEVEHYTSCHAESPRSRGGEPLWRCIAGRNIHTEGEWDDGPCPECDGTGLIERADPLLVPVRATIETILASYFDIDLDKVEAERRQILQDIRTQTKEST